MHCLSFSSMFIVVTVALIISVIASFMSVFLVPYNVSPTVAFIGVDSIIIFFIVATIIFILSVMVSSMVVFKAVVIVLRSLQSTDFLMALLAAVVANFLAVPMLQGEMASVMCLVMGRGSWE